MFKTKLLRVLIAMVRYPDFLEELPENLSKALQFHIRMITSVAVIINKMRAF